MKGSVRSELCLWDEDVDVNAVGANGVNASSRSACTIERQLSIKVGDDSDVMM